MSDFKEFPKGFSMYKPFVFSVITLDFLLYIFLSISKMSFL